MKSILKKTNTRFEKILIENILNKPKLYKMNEKTFNNQHKYKSLDEYSSQDKGLFFKRIFCFSSNNYNQQKDLNLNTSINKIHDSNFSEPNIDGSMFSLKLNENQKFNFDAFYSKMKENIKIIMDAKHSGKDHEALDEKLLNMSKEDLNHFQNSQNLLNSENNNAKNITDSYERINEFKDTVMQNRGKFVMPLFWGWATPFVKWGSLILLTSQQITCLPWLPFFVFSGIVVRMLIFPLMLRQMILIQRMAKVSPNIRLLSYCVMKCDLPITWKTYYYVRSILKYSKDVNVNLISFVAYNLIQLPIFLLMVWSIRKIATEQDLTNTGILWFPNLNEADPYMILPIISVVLTYFNLGRGINKENEHWFINKWRSFFQVLQIFYLPFTCQWPVGSHIYWITSSLMANFQNYISKHPFFMSRINPTFYIDMQKVFQSERNKADSERYIEKLRNCEDPIIKSPTNNSNVLYEMDYEKNRMLSLQKTLKYKRKIKKYNEGLIAKFKQPFGNPISGTNIANQQQKNHHDTK